VAALILTGLLIPVHRFSPELVGHEVRQGLLTLFADITGLTL